MNIQKFQINISSGSKSGLYKRKTNPKGYNASYNTFNHGALQIISKNTIESTESIGKPSHLEEKQCIEKPLTLKDERHIEMPLTSEDERRTWVFFCRLSSASVILNKLINNEGFRRRDRMKKNKRVTSNFSQTMQNDISELKTHANAISDTNSEALSTSTDSGFKIDKPSTRLSLGSAVWTCKHAGKPKKKSKVQRARKSSKINCPARFTIRLNYGYFHANEQEVNVKDFGEDKVKVTWQSKHNHTLEPCDRKTRQELSKVLKEAVAEGYT